jgi:hypothetical protein
VQLDAGEATELIKKLKADDVLTPDERARLAELVRQNGDHFEPEARRLVAAFLQDGTPLTGGVLPDPKLSWDTKDPAELKVPRGARLVIDGIRADDVKQNQLGDCFLMASVSALAAVRPKAIEDAITDHGDGTFTVRFFEKAGKGQPLRPVEVRVDADLPMKRSGEILYGQGTDRAELWPAIVEKAWAAWKGGYGELAIGGYARDALEAITGTPGDFYNPIRAVESKALWDTMLDAQATGRAMVIGSNGEGGLEGLVPNHMYAVVGLREVDGEKRVRLRNPYGEGEPGKDRKDDGVFELSLRDLRKHFEDLYLSGPAP